MTKGEFQAKNLSQFLLTYKDLSKSEMIGLVGFKEEAKLSDVVALLLDLRQHS